MFFCFIFVEISNRTCSHIILKWFTKNLQRKSIVSLASLSETHQLLYKTCRDFGEGELKPVAAKTDQKKLFPKKQVGKITCYIKKCVREEGFVSN